MDDHSQTRSILRSKRSQRPTNLWFSSKKSAVGEIKKENVYHAVVASCKNGRERKNDRAEIKGNSLGIILRAHSPSLKLKYAEMKV
jgi:hypothetical protein